MAVPKRRQCNTRTNKRRSHDAIGSKSTSVCSNCGARKIPHRVCKKCGFYRGKQVVMVKVKEKKKK